MNGLFKSAGFLNRAGRFAGGTLSGLTGFGAPKSTAGKIGKGIGKLTGIAGTALALNALTSSAGSSEDYSKYATLAHPAMDKILKGIMKRGFDADKIRSGVDIASYLSLIAPLVLRIASPEKYHAHSGLMHGLEAAGLTGLAGTSVHNLATQKPDTSWVPEAANIAGLALMGGGLAHVLKNH